MFVALSKMFDWLVEKRRLRANPCIGVHPTGNASIPSRERVLGRETESRGVLASNGTPSARSSARCSSLLLLTRLPPLNEVAQNAPRRAER